jgi:hypothetical protein
MPIDGVARRYAEELYHREEEQIREWHQAEMIQVRGKYATSYPVKSGQEVSELAGVVVEWTSKLAQARTNSLVKAYEKSGVLFDDMTLREVTDEVEQFSTMKQYHAVHLLSGEIQRIFGSESPPGLRHSIKSQIENGVRVAVAGIIRDLRIRRYEVILDETARQRIYASATGKQWDVFISHASEDKAEFVDPLAEALGKSGLTVWYDKTTLTVGDSLRKKIDQGLANSRFGIVVLSHNFFKKSWPQHELDGLFARQVEGVKIVLPVWHKITAEEVRHYSPMLGGLLAANSSHGLNDVVHQLRQAMGLN